MARIRTIKPEFWADEKLAALDALTRLVFLGLISQADDCGRLLDSPKMLNGLLFPYTDEDSTTSLRLLADASVIRRGKTASGKPVIQIVGWTKHQRIEKPNTSAALPEIADTSPTRRGSVGDTSATCPGHVASPIYDLRSTNNDLRSGIVEVRDDGDDDVPGWEEFMGATPALYRPDVQAAIRAAGKPDALRRQLVSMVHPITGGESFTPAQIAQALHELAVAGSRVTSAGLRAFCRRLAAGDREISKATDAADAWSKALKGAA
jgi:hypothetical protein